ncbi:hypothetical protein GLOIN_2v1520581, partial [Rhizophagus irregularis DAOM 181602=DAOM 197198]
MSLTAQKFHVSCCKKVPLNHPYVERNEVINSLAGLSIVSFDEFSERFIKSGYCNNSKKVCANPTITRNMKTRNTHVLLIIFNI